MAVESRQLAEPGATLSRPRELAMSAAWNGALQRSVRLTTGEQGQVVYHGSWSNGMGPDFHGAMLEFGNGKLVTGDVEIHFRASDWISHRHHLDPAYNNVVLHIVSVNDLEVTRCENGAIVPVAILELPEEALFAIDQRLPQMWDQLGGSVCAESLAKRSPEVIRAALHALGDERFRNKSVLYEADILERGCEPVLTEALFESFGYSANKAPMKHLAELVNRYEVLKNPKAFTGKTPNPWLVGVLLGMGGFLPLSPADAHAAGILPEDQYLIERSWFDSGAMFAGEFVPAISWQMARTRPANHPAYRIMQLATLLARTAGSPLKQLREIVHSGGDVVTELKELTSRPWHPGLGFGRSTAIAASVVLPILAAIASIERDDQLEDAVVASWITLRHAEWTQPAKRALKQVTGGPGVRKLGERGHQGLLHLDRELCEPRKCSACPIAKAVLTHDLR